MLSFNMSELILILIIALVVFGPGKLPEVGKALSKGIDEFRQAMNSDNTKEQAINFEAKKDTETKKSSEIK